MPPVRSLLLAACTILSSGFADAALAATMKVTYTGTIAESFDQKDLFETGGTSLDGLSFAMEIIYDTALAGFEYADAGMNIAYGGPGEFGNGNPVVSTAFTVNGHTETIDGDFSGRVSTFDDGNQSGIHQDNKDYFFDAAGYVNKYLEMNVLNLGAVFSASLDDAVPLTLFGLDVTASGSFYFGSCTYDAEGNCSDAYHYAFGRLLLGSVQISQVGAISAVPLPAGLPMLGLALAGLLLVQRRRQRSSIAVSG